MRVVAGTARGVRLRAKEGLTTRPTTDRVKEAVFGSLQFDIPGAKVLDLFAGSGGMGIEALSRGAESAVFVERDREAVRIIKSNLEATRLTQRARVMAEDCQTAVSALCEPFDFIFMDPPYACGVYQSICDALTASGAFGAKTVLIAEHDGRGVIAGLMKIKEKKYGKTVISFYRLGE